MNQYTVWFLVYVVFCCVVAEFFIVGCLGYSSNSGTSQDAAWVVEDQESSTVFYALQVAFYNGAVEGISVHNQECADTNQECYVPRLISADTLAMVALMMFGILMHSSRQVTTFCCANPKIKIMCVTLVVSVVALVAFMCDCYHEVDDTVGADWVWGPESVLSLVGLLLAVCAKVKKVACREQHEW